MPRPLLRRTLASLPLLLLQPLAFSGSAQEPAPSGALGAAADPPRASTPWLTEEARRLHLESFDVVWQTIRDKHFDPELNGVDWAAVRDELRPRVEAARTADEAREVLSEMIDRLGQSHFGILPSTAYDSIEQGDQPRGDGVTGLHLRVVDGEALVVAVEEGYPAEAAGVRPGWIVRKVRNRELAPILARVAEAYAGNTQRDLYTARAAESRLRGPVGQTLPVEFLDGEGQPRTLELRLARPPGTPARFGNLPPILVEFDAKTLDGGVGYIAFSIFFDPSGLMPRIAEAVEKAIESNAPGLILDLRGNPGGIGAMAMGVGGWFISERGKKLGTMITRDSRLNFVVLPRPRVYQGPLAILVDGCSASTTEILAGGLKDLGRARIFGTPTAGAALPSIIVRLPNGDGFQYAFANYIAEGGQPLEGRGVQPDEVVPPERNALLRGSDPALDAALAWIRAQSAPADNAAEATASPVP